MHRNRRALGLLALVIAVTSCGTATARTRPAAQASNAQPPTAHSSSLPAASGPDALPPLNSGGWVLTPSQDPVIHVPADLPPGQVPLVIVLHGSGATPAQAAADYGLNPLADQDHFIAAYLGTGSPVGKSYILPQDTTYISQEITALERSYPVDPSRVYVTGFSAGGYESFRVGCLLSDQVAAVAPVAVSMNRVLYDTCQLRRPVSTLIIVGSADPHYGGVGGLPSAPQAAARWRALDQCPPTGPLASEVAGGPTDVQLWSACADGSAVGLDVISGGGHIWPGPHLSPASPDSRFSAATAVWTFFSGLRAGSATTPDARLRAVHVSARAVQLTLGLGEPVHVRAWLSLNGHRLAARRQRVSASGGQAGLRLPLRGALAPGRYRLRLVITDTYGRTTALSRILKLR
jgi:polyhydroxybutyrate depolymerase